MMGKRYDFVKLIWDIENPIKITNDFLSAWGMQLGSGGDPAAIILIDLKKNIIYAAVREEGNLEVYSENGSKAPTFLEENKW